MNCRKCGRKNSSNATVCKYCGYPLARSKSINVARTPKQANVQKPKAQQHHHAQHKQAQNNSNLVIIVLIVILSFALVFGAIIYFYNENTSNGRGFSGGGGGGGVGNLTINQTPDMDPGNQPSAPPEEAPEQSEQDAGAENVKKKADALAKYNGYKSRAEKLTERLTKDYEGVTSLSAREEVAQTHYKEWDVLLNEIYLDLKNYMSEDAFEALKQDEENWIQEKENAVEKILEQNAQDENVLYLAYLTATEKTRERVDVLLNKLEDCVNTLP